MNCMQEIGNGSIRCSDSPRGIKTKRSACKATPSVSGNQMEASGLEAWMPEPVYKHEYIEEKHIEPYFLFAPCAVADPAFAKKPVAAALLGAVIFGRDRQFWKEPGHPVPVSGPRVPGKS